MDPLIELPGTAKARIKTKEKNAAEQFGVVRRACDADVAIAHRNWGGYFDLHQNELQSAVDQAGRVLDEAAIVCAQYVFSAHATEYLNVQRHPEELRPILERLRDAVVKQYGEGARDSIQHCEAAEMEKAEQRYEAITHRPPHGGAESRMESLLVDPRLWRQLRKDFDDLGARQLATLQQDTHPKWLKAYCSFFPEFGEFGKCRIVGGFDGRLISDFEDVATRGACALGCPAVVEPVGFWLYCLAQDLLRASKPEIRREFSPGNENGGYIPGLLDSSAGYCSRLAAKAEHHASVARHQKDGPPPATAEIGSVAAQPPAGTSSEDPKPTPPEQAITERAARRQAAVMPILKEKRWKPGRLATTAGVGKNSVYDYLDGTRVKITDENREAIAGALGLKPEQLPD